MSQDTFEFILNMKAVILNRFKSGNPPMFLNFRAVTNGSTKTRNPESGNGNGIMETESVKEGSKRSI